MLSDCLLSTRVKDWPEGAIGSVRIDYHIWDINRFFRAAMSNTGPDEVTVDFARASTAAIQAACHALRQAPLAAPTKPISAWSRLIFSATYMIATEAACWKVTFVHSSLRREKSIQGIRTTLVKQPQMFFAYNNGISAVASSVDIQQTPSGPRMVTATNLQIVNGGQTTASIDNVQRNDRQVDLAYAFVPMKLSVVMGDESTGMVADISRCANSQNKVSDADFFRTIRSTVA